MPTTRPHPARAALLLALAALLPSAGAWAQPTSLPSGEPVASRVERVTVYANGAQVTRTGAVRVPAGTTAFVFAGLPAGLDAARLAVTGEGAFTLLSVTTRAGTPDAAPPDDRLAPRRDALADSLALARALLDVYRQEERLLLANTDVGGQNGVQPDELRAAAVFLRARLTEVKTL